MDSKLASILIVDDDADTREFLVTCLQSRYACATAASAEGARELFTAGCFDVALVDVMLPGASGFELCKQIRGKRPETIVIIMSAGPEIEFEREAARQRAFEYLKKPFSLSHLYISIERALRHQAFIREWLSTDARISKQAS